MIDLPYLGLTGPAGAGKDTVYERLRELGGDRFVRLSVADPLKESVAALFGITLEKLEEIKRDDASCVSVAWLDRVIADSKCRGFTMREFLQRYGTEAHRDVFGEDFWLDVWETRASSLHREYANRDWRELVHPTITVVNTSVRFPNEAQRILDLGGEIWDIVGPQDYGAAGHASETPLPRDLVTHVIDNENRLLYASGEPNYAYLDDQIAGLIR